jgi:hypothetical protein
MLQYVRCTAVADAYSRMLAEADIATRRTFMELRAEEPLVDRAMYDELNLLHNQLAEKAHHYRQLASRHLKAALAE